MTWQNEMQRTICEIAIKENIKAKDLLGFLTATLVGQFALCELEPVFVKKTLDKMYEEFIMKHIAAKVKK